MSQPSAMALEKTLLEGALRWFQHHFGAKVVETIQSQFPGFPLPADIQAILHATSAALEDVSAWPGDPISVPQVGQRLSKSNLNSLPLLKQVLLLYRRSRAGQTERLTEKTFHLELTGALVKDVKLLDALVNEDWFQQIALQPLPRLKDFLPVQYVESATSKEVSLAPRQFDEKFHILQAPSLFLPDLAYFRAKCEDRDMPLAVAFLDIDHFKRFNDAHGDTKVDRNLLPRFMQTVEAHVFHHGYAYRQGGDEYLLLVPSLSRSLAITFADELRCKLADLKYPEIGDQTTVSIGLCIVDTDCPLTDRELRDRASHGKKFAKDSGRNCIATYRGPRYSPDELHIVAPHPS